MSRVRMVHRIMIGKVVGLRDLERTKPPPLETWHGVAQSLDQRICPVRVDLLVVVTRIVVAAMDGPVITHDLRNAPALRGQDIEPDQDRPQPIFLAYVVRSGAGALLSAN